jgi:L-cystine uptake protein TcyP (sodium:dicarboxylate symporter family)
MTLLATTIVKAVILPLLSLAKHDMTNAVLVAIGLLFGLAMPCCEAMADGASTAASKTVVGNFLVPLLAATVVPAIFLNIDNDEQDRPPVRCEWAGGESYSSLNLMLRCLLFFKL